MEESIHVSSFGSISTRTNIPGLRVGMVPACWCVSRLQNLNIHRLADRLVGRNQSLLQTLLLPVIGLSTLLPTPLLEPRYFLIPYILLRAQVPDVPVSGQALEGIWYSIINVVTMGIFLYHPRGDIRFMW